MKREQKNIHAVNRFCTGCFVGMLMVLCQVVGAQESKPADNKEHDLPTIKPPVKFEQLKQLVGHWEGFEESPQGKKPVAVEYQLTSAGTALTEKLFPGTDHEMLSVYHGDGNNIMMTHYCAFGNQPRMLMQKSDDPKVFKFVYMDGTSMKSADDPHMHQVTLNLVSEDRLTHEWVFYQDGQAGHVVKFDLHRKK